ncbi:MAG: class IV adenylate cyclase [Phycisphaerales bacterium]
MQNVEFKAELRDLALARSICRVIGAEHIETLEQVDTYFNAADARFKRRDTAGRPAQYILYHRKDRVAPKVSRYEILSEQQAAARFGRVTPPPAVVVKKKRDVYLIDCVRIHLDRVEDLGDFLEFEALVSPKRTLRRCHESVRRLREQFAPALGEPVSCGYADLLIAAEKPG